VDCSRSRSWSGTGSWREVTSREYRAPQYSPQTNGARRAALASTTRCSAAFNSHRRQSRRNGTPVDRAGPNKQKPCVTEVTQG
jgi:hypothetical protein